MPREHHHQTVGRSPLPTGSAHLYNPHQHPRSQTPGLSPAQQEQLGIPTRTQTHLGRGVSGGGAGAAASVDGGGGMSYGSVRSVSGGGGEHTSLGGDSFDRYVEGALLSPPMSPPKPSSMFRSSESAPRRPPAHAAETPGPGQYSTYSSLNIDKRKRPAHLQFFGSTGERFQEGPRTIATLSAQPGPGAYKAIPSDFDRTKANKWSANRPPDEMVGFKSNTQRCAIIFFR